MKCVVLLYPWALEVTDTLSSCDWTCRQSRGSRYFDERKSVEIFLVGREQHIAHSQFK